MKILKKSLFLPLFIFLVLWFGGAEEKTETFHLQNGIPVYVKNITNDKIDVLYFVVKGGTAYFPSEMSGLEEATFSLMTMASKKYDYDAIQALKYDTRSSFSSYSTHDGAVFSMESINYYFDETFDCFIDCFLNPRFNEKEYNLIMTNYAQDVQEMMNDPSSLVFYYAQKAIYEDHPYSTVSYVTPDSIKNISLDAIKNHHAQILDARRISVVAVGNYSLENGQSVSSLLALLEKRLGNLKPQNYELKSCDVPLLNISGENQIILHSAANGSGYVLRVFSSPAVTDKDYPVARIASDIYSDVLYNVVRENYGDCYTPQSSVLSSASPYGYEYLYRVSNLKDFSAHLKEARKIMENGRVIAGRKKGKYVFDKLENRLTGYINSYINKKYATQATKNGIASRIAASILQFGDISSADHLTEIAKTATKDDILRVFKKYWLENSSRWFVVVSENDKEKVKI